jgi:hypothetical protein
VKFFFYYFGDCQMTKRIFAAATCCAIAAGCATLPSEAIDHVSLASVEERVKCEIGKAYVKLRSDPEKRFPDLQTWAAGLTLTLAVDSTGGVTPSTSLIGPFGSVSPLDLSISASLNAKRTALLNVFIAFADAAEHICPPASPILLEGHLGLEEWIVRVFQSQYEVDQKATLRSGFNAKDDKSIGYTIEFLITLGAGATPNFIIANTTGSKVGFGVESKSTHSVDIAMAEMDPNDFEKRFKKVVVPGKIVDVPNPLADPDFKGIRPLGADADKVPKTIPKRLPSTTQEKLVTVPRLGTNTKLRLEGVLQQLNNKLLIQSLRR